MSTAVDTDIPMRLEPVDERSVWLGDELRRDDKWSHQITDTELRELLAATETVHSAGLRWAILAKKISPADAWSADQETGR